MKHEWRARELKGDDTISINCEACRQEFFILIDERFMTCDCRLSRACELVPFENRVTKGMKARFQALYRAVLGNAVPWAPESLKLTEEQCDFLEDGVKRIFEEEHTRPIENQRRHLEACLTLKPAQK